MKRKWMYLLFVVICFATYPILRYYYFVYFDPYTQESTFYIAVRVLFSGPLLLLSGIILIRFYKQWVFGLLSIILGLWVIAIILQALPSI